MQIFDGLICQQVCVVPQSQPSHFLLLVTPAPQTNKETKQQTENSAEAPQSRVCMIACCGANIQRDPNNGDILPGHFVLRSCLATLHTLSSTCASVPINPSTNSQQPNAVFAVRFLELEHTTIACIVKSTVWGEASHL